MGELSIPIKLKREKLKVISKRFKKHDFYFGVTDQRVTAKILSTQGMAKLTML